MTVTASEIWSTAQATSGNHATDDRMSLKVQPPPGAGVVEMFEQLFAAFIVDQLTEFAQQGEVRLARLLCDGNEVAGILVLVFQLSRRSDHRGKLHRQHGLVARHF